VRKSASNAIKSDRPGKLCGLVAAHEEGPKTFVEVYGPFLAVRLLGLEPKTYGLKVRCSTN
jgi:hypothetical protein